MPTTMEPCLPPEPPAPPRLRLFPFTLGLLLPPLGLLVALLLKRVDTFMPAFMVGLTSGWLFFCAAVRPRFRGISYWTLVLAYPMAEMTLGILACVAIVQGL